MKKLISILLAVVLITGVGMTSEQKVQAADNMLCVDGSYLLSDDVTSTEGELLSSTWGYYLASGSSSLVEKGTGKIGAGGDTSAHRVVDEISVVVKVQRLVNGYWEYYYTWDAEKTDAAYVSTSKILNVPTGYYYRTVCSHYAASDSGSSNTDGLYI